MAIIQENIAEMTAKIDLKENKTYVVKDGQIKQIDPPSSGHGEHSLIYKNNKVIRIEKRETVLI
ncbi:DUF3954 domain-containing protein [Bacillus cytotoxicus]|uniref:DUF3954 domain-containing protein n=1 Tax=Bacillus cytotoxicus TaxID=580165 RepID=A0ACC6A7K8_9BACI|nr:DUF3954 domain-containing protein [Bacillus cytotoxicus]